MRSGRTDPPTRAEIRLTGLKTIAGKTTNDEKFLKTLICRERKTSEQIPEEYKEHKAQSSTRFDVVSYDD